MLQLSFKPSTICQKTVGCFACNNLNSTHLISSSLVYCLPCQETKSNKRKNIKLPVPLDFYMQLLQPDHTVQEKPQTEQTSLT